jgi:two-component system cell cycle sensor histidine kinase/response regulator CckA
LPPTEDRERQSGPPEVPPRGVRFLGPAFWITAIYALVSVVWIGVSDRVVAAVVRGPEDRVFWSTVKGVGFIAVTGFLLLLGIRWALAKERASLQKIVDGEDLFRAEFDDHAAVKLLVEPDSGRIIDANHAAADYYGWPRERLRRMRVQDINTLSPAEVAREMQRARDLSRTQFEFRHRRADGSVRDVDVFSSKSRVAGRDLLHSTIHDITQRKQAEQEARDLLSQVRVEKDRLTALLDSIQDEVWFMDPEGRVVLANKAAILAFGTGAAGGTGIQDLARSLEVYRADGSIRPLDESPVLRALQGDPVANQEEIVRTPASGELRYRQVNSTPVRDALGSVIGAVSVVRDITEHKKADAERDRLATAIEQAAETVVITDAQGSITYVNPAFELVTGYTRAEALGQNPRILKSGVQNGAFYDTLWQTITSGRTWRGRLVNRRKDGRAFTEEATVSPVRDAAGTIRSFVAVKRDISGELDLEARLLQSQKLESVGRLAGGVAHDFNNLLTVILSAGEDLRQAAQDGKPSDLEELDEILGAGKRAADLTRQLLAFARRQVIAPVPLRLNEAVRASERLLRRVIGEDIHVVEQFQPDLGVVLCDPGLLDQVVMNLVVNAKDAMPGGGTLTLATEDVVVGLGDSVPDPEMGPGPYVRLSVTDDGAGMSPDVMAHLFEPFFTTKETGKGTGLGLATVYGIVKQSNAFVDVRSTPGHGTTFAIYFPRVTVGEGGPASTPSRSSSGGETVLLIEDDATVRHAAERALRSAGYRVLAAGGGAQAIELLQRETAPLHLILTDVVMHGQGGREVARRITELRPGVRTLYMSGYTHEAISQHGVLDEGLDFLPKPFTPSVLLSRVRQSLDRVFPGTDG